MQRIGPGVDLKGRGGYVLLPGSRGVSGALYGNVPRADGRTGASELPPWLRRLIEKPKPPPRPSVAPRALTDGDGTPYGLAALEAEAEAVRTAREGGRNHRLNEAAFALGQLEAGGELAPGVAEEALRAAGLAAGLGETEIVKTLASGLDAGRAEPRRAPERVLVTGGAGQTRPSPEPASGDEAMHEEPRTEEGEDGAAREQSEDGAALLEAVVSFIRRFMVLGDCQAHAVALWVVHTWAFEAAHATPYLHVGSAEKESGKSRLTDEVLGLLVRGPLSTVNISEAALVRLLKKRPITLLFDEIDGIFGPKPGEWETLRGILNAGHRRGATVVRCVGEGKSLGVEEFPVFCPKVLSGLGTLPDTLESRSIPIRLKRRRRDEPIDRYRRRRVEAEAEALRERLECWAAENLETLAAAEPELPEELSDRSADCWEPLFAIADLAGGEWPARGRRAALELSAGEDRRDDSIRVRLLAAVRQVFDETGAAVIFTRDLIRELSADRESRWADWWDADASMPAKGSEMRLAKMLREHRIRSQTIWPTPDKSAKGYRREDFEDAFSQYLAPKSSKPSEGLNQAGLEGSPSRQNAPSLTACEPGATPHGYAVLTGLTDRNPVQGETSSLEGLSTASMAAPREHYADEDEGPG